jgi:hypothetical protein
VILAITITSGAVQAIIAITASFVGSKKLTYKEKRPYFWFFAGAAVLGCGLTVWLAVLNARSSEEATRATTGDPDHPPFIAIISLPHFTRFVVTNNSDYPSYGIRIRVFDTTAKGSPGFLVRNYVYSEIPAHAGLVDDEGWYPPDASPQRHFTVAISARTGVYSEDLVLRHDNNDQWARAARVTQGMRLLETDIDSNWERNAKGEVDWN